MTHNSSIRLMIKKMIYGVIILLINSFVYSQSKDVDSLPTNLEEKISTFTSIPPSPFDQITIKYDNEGNLKYIDNSTNLFNSKENGSEKVVVKPYTLYFNFGLSSTKSSFDSIIPLLVKDNLIDNIRISTFGERKPEPAGVYVFIGSEIDYNILKILFDFFLQSKMEINTLVLNNYDRDPFMDNKNVYLGSLLSGETGKKIIIKDLKNMRRVFKSKTHKQMTTKFNKYNEDEDILKSY